MRTRTAGERGKPPADEVVEAVARPAEQPAAAATDSNAATGNVEKCVNCQYYDRRRARPTDGKAPMWGQCRRHSPQLNPVTAKAYVIEGVWPLVRDDDWCGEWTVLTRVIEEPIASVPLQVDGAPAAEPVATPAPVPVAAAAPARARPAPADAHVAPGD